MEWKFTNGFSPEEFVSSVSMSDDTALTNAQKDVFVTFSCSAASKVLTLGLNPGQVCIIANVGGTNAVTVKNISTDTGTSVAAGKVAFCVGGTTTDTSLVYVLN